jgi:hypothetical protein
MSAEEMQSENTRLKASLEECSGNMTALKDQVRRMRSELERPMSSEATLLVHDNARLRAEVQALRGDLPAGFLSDVMTAAGLVSHGKQCKALGDRLSYAVMSIRMAAPQPAAPPTEPAKDIGVEQDERVFARIAAMKAQQAPQKTTPSYIDGYNAGMADAKRMAQQEPARKPLFAEMIAKHPGLREELLLKDAQPAAQPTERCKHCDGTGDVHSITGEWLGSCVCEAAHKIGGAE